MALSILAAMSRAIKRVGPDLRSPS